MFKNIFFTIAVLSISLASWAADFTIHNLPNGQTLITQEIHSNPIVTIDTWVKTGSINETDTNSGVSHFLEHLFFKGTKKHPKGEFDRILEAKGAIVNAATSKDFTHYYITIPSKDFDTALDLHSDMILNPQIPRKELEQERKVVLEEISISKAKPEKIAYENMNSMLYTNHPYKRTVLGSENVISTISREEILDYFNKFYSPSNMTTVIIGDIKTEDVIKKVSEKFNAVDTKNVKKAYKKDLKITSQKRKVEYVEANTGYLMLGFRGTDILNDDIYALDVLSTILAGGKSSILNQNLKEQKSIVSSISASNGAFKDDGIFAISASFIPSNAEKVEKNIFQEINKIQKYGVTEEDLNFAKKIIEQETYFSKESTSDIAFNLGYYMTIANNIDIYNNYITNIKKVTLQDVQNVAKKYLGVEKSVVSLVLPNNLEKNIEKTTIKHNYKKIAEKNCIEKYLLDNNLTILVNKHNNNDIIAISIFAKGGKFLEKVKGEGTLLQELLLKSTKKYSSQELALLMEKNGIVISPECVDDYFKINIKTTVPQISLTLEILDEIFNNSLLEEKEIEKKRIEILNKIKQRRDVPTYVAMEDFMSLIYPNSVYSQTNKVIEKTLPNITKNNIAEYYNKIFDAKNIVISINGNVDSEVIIQNFGNIFQNKNQEKFEYNNYKVNKLTEHKSSLKNIKDNNSAWIFLGWQASDVNNKKDFVTLKLIDTILGGGMSSRIYQNLREKEGLAYQLGSYYSAKALGGIFYTFIGTNPDSVNYSKEKLLEEIEKLKMEFISDTELQNAKDMLKGNFIIAQETNLQKSQNIGNLETIGLGFDFMDTYIKMIDETSASDILRVANKYFNNIYIDAIVK